MARTPRLDAYERLIYRFFEAVYLLSLLGNIRGPHLATVFNPLSLISIRRRFLKNLAFLCDSRKGGETTASIAIQDRPECYVFWVSSNRGPSDTTLDFLRSVLEAVKTFVRSPQGDRAGVESNLIRKCVHFSVERMHSQARTLVNRVRVCRNHLLKNPGDNLGTSLAEWLRQFSKVKFCDQGLHHLCMEAYRVRNDPEMLAMEKLGQRLHNVTCAEDISSTFTRVRHIIGRLAAHMRVVKQLLDDGIHLDEFLEAYKVSAVPVPPSVPQPPADDQTDLRGIMTRILEDGTKDPRFESTLGYLSHMDQKEHLEEKLTDLHSPERKPHTVHAEVQMLHHFHDNGLIFAESDRYIATSKPACMCCRLYFRHHPAMPVEPDTHQRVWPSWGPPLLPLGRDEPGWTEQRDVLNSVVRDIRREVLMVIEQRQAISFAHPDSVTGDTHSIDAGFSDSEDTGSGDAETEDAETEDGLWDDDDEDVEPYSEFDGGVKL